jgi:hypothetical protein
MCSAFLVRAIGMRARRVTPLPGAMVLKEYLVPVLILASNVSAAALSGKAFFDPEVNYPATAYYIRLIWFGNPVMPYRLSS